MLSGNWRQIRQIQAVVILAGCCIVLLKGAASSAAQPAAGAGAPWLRCNSTGRTDSIGININNLAFSEINSDNVITALDQSGVGWVRANIYWGWIERQRGAINWQPIDAALDRLAAAHVTAMVTINGPVPCWASGGPKGCSDAHMVAPPVSEWVSFVKTVVTRYKQRVHYWEIWNEPDLVPAINEPDPAKRLQEYRNNILIPGAQAVHSVDPTAKVIGPTFAGIPGGHTGMGPDLHRALVTVLSPPASSLIDIVSFHSYFPEDINAKAIEVRNAMREVGMPDDKPIWITEIGLPRSHLAWAGQQYRGRGDLMQRQSDFVHQQTSMVLSHGNAQRVFWFTLSGTSDKDDDYDLIDRTGATTWSPRPAYTRLQSLVSGSCGGIIP
jgi:hypothetical protein